MSEQTTPHDDAVMYLDAIVDGSLEDESRIWFENASYPRKAAAFVRVEAEVLRLRAALVITCAALAQKIPPALDAQLDAIMEEFHADIIRLMAVARGTADDHT
jgi:hypothetical protein